MPVRSELSYGKQEFSRHSKLSERFHFSIDFSIVLIEQRIGCVGKVLSSRNIARNYFTNKHWERLRLHFSSQKPYTARAAIDHRY